jgi:ParB family transcriptional regulator, chromosome partitioning protein
MADKRPDIGKGIRALLENMDTSLSVESVLPGGTQNIPLEQIEVNPFQPRHDFDEKALSELSDSIRHHGIIQPVTLRKIGIKKYQLIAGERRLRAARMADLTEVPAFIRVANDEEMLEMALIENTHREDLNAIEVALNYSRLMDECHLTQEQLAEKVSKDRSTVTNYLRLLKLPPDIQQGIKEKQISMAHARSIINIEDPLIQLTIFNEIKSRDLSVRQTEQLARQYHSEKKSTKKETTSIPYEVQRLQENLSSHLSTRVYIKRKGNGSGEIVISFFSNDDLDRITEQIGL